ncbi:MAG: hypothetical protein JW874_00070 [Spirochaetales bacterium]|nr:hypothetical protein [Spirochaetales bacterium]
MKAKNFFRLYLRSVAGIINLILPLAACALLLLAGFAVLPAVIASVAAGAAVFTFALVSGRASLAAVQEKDRLDKSGNLAALERARQARDRLAFLRLADEDIAGRVQYIVQKAGRYMELAENDGIIDPLAHHALENCIEIINLFLKERDDASSEKRFGMKDLDPFQNAKDRTLAALDREAVVIKDALNALDTGSSGNDRLSVMEDLEK